MTAEAANNNNNNNNKYGIELDVGNLAAFDATPLDRYGVATGFDILQQQSSSSSTSTTSTSTTANIETLVKRRATAAAQRLVDALFGLPVDEQATEAAGTGRVVILPRPSSVIPREKRLPQRDELLTKWERFAREKGIGKRRRDERGRLVWHEASEEWRPRFRDGRDKGRRPSVKSNDDQWLVEDKGPVAPGENPFNRNRKERQQNKRKNETKRARNEAAHERIRSKGKSAKQRVDGELGVVQRSTASVGKFDRRLDGERDLRGKGVKRKFAANTGGGGALGSERKQAARVADNVLKRAASSR